MSNIDQELLVFSIRVNSTHSCEANKSQISKLFICMWQITTLNHSHPKKKIKKDKS